MEYKRIMLKISGQALGGEDGTGIDSGTLERVCGEIAGMVEAGKEVAVVMGAGNFFRGVQGVAGGMDRVRSDQMGMIATLMNALALQDGLLRAGMQPIVMSAYETGTVVMPYNAHTGRMSLSKGWRINETNCRTDIGWRRTGNERVAQGGRPHEHTSRTSRFRLL